MTHATRFVAAVAVLVATSCSEAERDLAETSSPALETTDTLRASAEQGDATAQLVLAMGYEHGNGVPQDYVLAHMWYNLAASRSTGEQRDESVSNRDRPAGQLTPDGLNEAQRLASPDAPIPVLTEHIPTAMPCPRRRLPLSRTNQCASG